MYRSKPLDCHPGFVIPTEGLFGPSGGIFGKCWSALLLFPQIHPLNRCARSAEMTDFGELARDDSFFRAGYILLLQILSVTHIAKPKSRTAASPNRLVSLRQ